MNDQEPEKADAAAQAVWNTYDPELQAAIIAGDPIAERLYRAEAEVERLKEQES